MYCFKKVILIVFAFTAFAIVSAQEYPFAKRGTFAIGCNYWASHAGTHMWSDWQPEVIEEDFKQLSSNGIKYLRIFPLWPDFQPIYQIYSGEGKRKYIAFKDGPLPFTPAGQNGVSEIQLQHFETVAALAKKYKLKLVVGLVTGWMSGQLYVPPALEGKNILSDPISLFWQQKFVSTFVNRLKSQEAIIAWDLGNECNVMEKLNDYHQAYTWTSVISGAILSADNTRPVVSGMHSLSPDNNAVWRIEDQAALCDVVTTHPYSLFTAYANQDGINTMRTILHGAAENTMYADIGGKPSLVEETGVMGPMTSGEKEKSAFARTALFSNWANDCKGTFWWCAYDQTKFDYPPYIYASVEQELGLIKENRSPKPVLGELKKFSNFIDNLPFAALPARKTEAVCILTNNQDGWAAAYSSFILAKQAGFDISFQKSNQDLKDASLYLMPSIKGIDPVFNDCWKKLLEKVKQGSSLYISIDDAYLPSLTEPMGIEILLNIKRRDQIKYIGTTVSGDSLNFSLPSERKYIINNKTATVLAAEPDGNPAFMEASYGKGKIYLLTFPLEMDLAKQAGAFDKGQPLYRNIYQEFAKPFINERIITQPDENIAVTEHQLSMDEKIIILINYNSREAGTVLNIKDGWKITGSLYGKMPVGKTIQLQGNDALVLVVKRG
jgi:hypothetical protein